MNKKALLLGALFVATVCLGVVAYKAQKAPLSSERIEASFALEMLLGAICLLDDQKALTNFNGEVDHHAILKVMPPDFGGLMPPLSMSRGGLISDASGNKIWIYRFRNASGLNGLSSKYRIIVHSYGANSINENGNGDDSFWGLRWDGRIDRVVK